MVISTPLSCLSDMDGYGHCISLLLNFFYLRYCCWTVVESLIHFDLKASHFPPLLASYPLQDIPASLGYLPDLVSLKVVGNPIRRKRVDFPNITEFLACKSLNKYALSVCVRLITAGWVGR